MKGCTLDNNENNKKKQNSESDEIETTPVNLEKIPPEFRQLFLQYRKTTGPLPPPDDLKNYESILKGFANRLLKIHEQEQEFRHKFSENILNLIKEKNKNGQILSFIIAIVSILAGTAIAIIAGTIPSIAPFAIGGLGLIIRIVNSLIKNNDD